MARSCCVEASPHALETSSGRSGSARAADLGGRRGGGSRGPDASCSFREMCFKIARTAEGEMISSSAISRSLFPRAASLATCFCVSVNPSGSSIRGVSSVGLLGLSRNEYALRQIF